MKEQFSNIIVTRELNESANKCISILMDDGLEPLIRSGENVVEVLSFLLHYCEQKEEFETCSILHKLLNSFQDNKN